MTDVFVHSASSMGTVVTVEVIGYGETKAQRAERTEAVARALAWFQHVEARCSRFDSASELRQLGDRVGVPVPVSATVFEAARFALALAEETNGAFDPTVGHAMVARGFDRHYQTGATVAVAPHATASYRDVEIDAARSTITLHRPMHLDLGGVAKGLAVDLAAKELEPFGNFAIDAGGDVFVGGHNATGAEWSVGIRHPREEGAVIDSVLVSNAAVCTSGDYEHPRHILDPRVGDTPAGVASATVIAPLAMVADGLATAAFVLGHEQGIELLSRHGVHGLIVTPRLERFSTPGFPRG